MSEIAGRKLLTKPEDGRHLITHMHDYMRRHLPGQTFERKGDSLWITGSKSALRRADEMAEAFRTGYQAGRLSR
jgi:hypothetical protein